MKRFFVVFVMLASISYADIDYSLRYETFDNHRPKKSARQIIKEILNRKKVEKAIYDNTIPIPLHDLTYPHRMENLA